MGIVLLGHGSTNLESGIRWQLCRVLQQCAAAPTQVSPAARIRA